MNRILGVFLLFVFASADAALIFIVDNYTTDELSFTIGGSLDADTTGVSPGYLAIKNDYSNNFGVHTEFIDDASTPTVTLNTILIGGIAPSDIFVRHDQPWGWADFIHIANPFGIGDIITAGTVVSGSLTVSAVGGFDPTDFSTLELVSGFDFFNLSRFEAAAVPIPASAWLFGSALTFLGWMRRRKTA